MGLWYYFICYHGWDCMIYSLDYCGRENNMMNGLECAPNSRPLLNTSFRFTTKAEWICMCRILVAYYHCLVAETDGPIDHWYVAPLEQQEGGEEKDPVLPNEICWEDEIMHQYVRWLWTRVKQWITKGNWCKSYAIFIINRYNSDCGGGWYDVLTMVQQRYVTIDAFLCFYQFLVNNMVVWSMEVLVDGEIKIECEIMTGWFPFHLLPLAFCRFGRVWMSRMDLWQQISAAKTSFW